MNTIFSIKKIAGIMEEVKKNLIIDSTLMREQTLSLKYPEGRTAYFKKKIFELQEQISKESFIGYAWVSLGSVYAVDADWLQRSMVHFYNKETGKIAWEALELFLRKYFQLLEYEEICKESETKPTAEPVKTLHKKKSDTNYPDKFYAWYHGIRIVLGKEPGFPTHFRKKEIIEFGNNTYGTSEVFYRVFHHLNLTQTYSFVKSMSKERANWKKKIIDISNNDADICDYLSNLSN
jgi:hypothetical protein